MCDGKKTEEDKFPIHVKESRETVILPAVDVFVKVAKF